MHDVGFQQFQSITFSFLISPEDKSFILDNRDTMKKFKIFDFVWAKLQGYRYWPAVVMKPGPDAPRRKSSAYGDKSYWVFFFGTHQFSWIGERHVKDYLSYKEQFMNQTKGVTFTNSIVEIEEHIEKATHDPSYHIDFKVTKKTRSKRRSKTPAPNSVIRNRISDSHPIVETCYGVLGTGNIGATIVSSLIKVGKKVYIWNRTKKKCEELVQELDHSYQSNLKICLSPRLVMQHSHIIFNCVSDCQGSKTIIERTLSHKFAPDNFMQGKGLVDMSGVDGKSTLELCKLVERSGGKYLEVRIQHAKVEGIGGGYLFLVGGDKDLFMACETCFYSLGGTPYYVNENVGYATKINLIIQIIKSVCLIGLSEAYSLIERIIPPEDQERLRRIFFSTPIACDYIKNKADKILHKKFTLVEQSMENLSRDIRWVMEMSDFYQEPMVMTALVDEIFQHCQKLGYGGKDPSAIFMRIRH